MLGLLQVVRPGGGRNPAWLAAVLGPARVVAKSFAGSGENHGAVFGVARDVGKGPAAFLMRHGAPLEFLALAVERHLKNPVAALELDGLVLVGVVLEFHSHWLPPYCGRLERGRPALAWPALSVDAL